MKIPTSHLNKTKYSRFTVFDWDFFLFEITVIIRAFCVSEILLNCFIDLLGYRSIVYYLLTNGEESKQEQEGSKEARNY